eukprot:4988211-Prymnesium_polylepis.1
MTAELEGSVEERPIELDAAATAPTSADTPAPAAAPAAAAPAAAEPTAEPTAAAAAPPVAAGFAADLSDDDEDEVEEAEVAETLPPAKKSCVDGSLLSFVTKHAPPAAKIAVERKVAVSKYEPKKPVQQQPNSQVGAGRGASQMKQGARVNDVSAATLKLKPSQFPGNGLRVANGQLFCVPCGCNISSAMQDVRKHCNEVQKHKEKLAALEASGTNLEEIKLALEDFTSTVKAETGKDPLGLSRVPKETQAVRGECLEEILKAGIPVAKIDKLRPYLERRMGISLTHSNNLAKKYIPPLKLKEEKTLRAEFKGELIGVYSDGTTHNGESFVIVFRACKP